MLTNSRNNCGSLTHQVYFSTEFKNASEGMRGEQIEEANGIMNNRRNRFKWGPASQV